MGGRGGSSRSRGNKKARNKAIKLLTQYERLAQKYGIKIPQKKLAELDSKREQGTISSDDLPGYFLKEFPGEFRGIPLNEL